jgi:hypothetical protein
VLGCDVFHETTAPIEGTVSRFVLVGSETVVELAQPVGPDSAAGQDLAANGEILHAVTFRSVDLERAAAHLAEHSVSVTHRDDELLVADPTACQGARIALRATALPADPRPT